MGELNTKADLNRVKNFVKNNNDFGVSAAAFRQGLENIDLNIQWMERNYQMIKNWLELKEKTS